jgi:hypothetical protein
MSICPKPDVVKKAAKGPAAKFTANPPATRTEACNATATTVVSSTGAATTTTVYVAGPPGPPGPKGDPGIGFKWEGNWAEGSSYVQQTQAHVNSSVVQRYGRTWMCIADHTASIENGPITDAQANDSSTAELYWQLVVGEDALTSKLLPAEKNFFDTLKDGVFDWVKNADLKDWLVAGAVAAGVIWAGSKVIDMMTAKGTDANGAIADQRFNGSPGFTVNNGSNGGAVYTAPSLKAVISSLCDFSQIIYDVSALSSADICEFVIGTNTSVRNILDQLALAYQFDMVNSAGVMKFIPRTTTSIKSITLQDMGYSTNAMPPAPFTATRYQGIDLPQTVSLTYSAADMDYNSFTQTAELFTYKEGQAVTITVPITLTHEKAKQITELSLVNSHLERMNYQFNTSYKFLSVEPGDVLDSPMGLIRILQVDEVDEGILKFSACDAGDDAALVASTMTVALPTPSTNVPTVIGASQAFFIDPTNLNDQDTGVRIYAAVHGYGLAGWPGANIYISEDGGNSYQQIGSTTKESTVGIVAAATPSAIWQVWDDTTQITVKLKTGSLLPQTDIAVLNGANQAQIGQELIGFANATLIAPQTYVLSRLLRGRQGTEQYVGTHAANELFCLMDSAVVRITLLDSDRKTTKQFKVVTNGSSLDVTTEENVQIISNNTRPWQVVNAQAALQTNGDWIITFAERVRFNGSLADFTTNIHDEDFGGFGIAILDASNITRSTQIVFVDSFTWTVAQQKIDFGVQQNHCRASIVPMSKKWGGGYPLIINS